MKKALHTNAKGLVENALLTIANNCIFAQFYILLLVAAFLVLGGAK